MISLYVLVIHYGALCEESSPWMCCIYNYTCSNTVECQYNEILGTSEINLL